MMLSRVAENLYWVGRYVERAENVARLLDVGFDLELDAAGSGAVLEGGEPAPVERVLTILACREAFEAAHGAGARDREDVLRFLTFDRLHDHSILSMIHRARENARATQEALSGEAWSHVNALYLDLNTRRAQRRFDASPPRFYSMVNRSCVLFAGLIDGTLPRSEAYHFVQFGRGLERANQVSRILQDAAEGVGPSGVPPERAIRWTALLRSCAAHEAYLRTHPDRIDAIEVLRYLVLDGAFPRSIRFCVTLCCDSLRAISGASPDGCASEVQRRLGRLDSELRYLDVVEIVNQGLGAFLVGLQESCNRVGDEIHHAYFHT